MADGTATESAKAAQAFADYVALGPKRSLRNLAEHYVNQGYAKTIPTQLTILKRWSTEHNWQERIAEAISARAMKMLTEASELDAETFLATSRLYHQRLLGPEVDKIGLSAIHEVRDQVKRPAGQSHALTVNVTIMQEAERLAAELGISADDLLKEAEAIAGSAWNKDS